MARPVHLGRAGRTRQCIWVSVSVLRVVKYRSGESVRGLSHTMSMHGPRKGLRVLAGGKTSS